VTSLPALQASLPGRGYIRAVQGRPRCHPQAATRGSRMRMRTRCGPTSRRSTSSGSEGPAGKPARPLRAGRAGLRAGDRGRADPELIQHYGCYEQAIADAPDPELIQHYGYLLACRGRLTLRRAVEQYVPCPDPRPRDRHGPVPEDLNTGRGSVRSTTKSPTQTRQAAALVPRSVTDQRQASRSSPPARPRSEIVCQVRSDPGRSRKSGSLRSTCWPWPSSCLGTSHR
jgi:hypothetical protein